MRVIVTAGPTREYIDTVRFITNASSGRMGCAVAEAAAKAGHQVTIVLADGIVPPKGLAVVGFRSPEDLAEALDERFAECDCLIMAAAVGDFKPACPSPKKLSRSAGPIRLDLVPVPDILAGIGQRKRPGQKIVAFAVQDDASDRSQAEARRKMLAKNADYIVLNTRSAIAAEASEACILSPAGMVLGWSARDKSSLAEEIVKLI